MLPLVSTTRPRLTGTRSLLKWVILLLDAVLVDDEVVLPQAGDVAAVEVADADGHVDQLHSRAEAEAVAFLAGRGLLRRRQRAGRDQQRGQAESQASSRGHLVTWAFTEESATGSRRSRCGTTPSSVRKLTR